MSTPRELHAQAMDALDKARLGTDASQKKQCLVQAYELEAQAAMLLLAKLDAEPTRCVLFRGAALLALELRDRDQAVRLAANGLAGRPTLDIRDELLDIIERVTFDRHLEHRGTELYPTDFNLVLTSGNAVAPGFARKDEVFRRIDIAETMILREAERQSGLPFRTTVRSTSPLLKHYETFISPPRLQSFAVTLRVGFQADLYLEHSTPNIIQSVVKHLSVFESGEEALIGSLPEGSYRESFLAGARLLQPDGLKVKAVNVSADSGDTVVAATLTRPKQRRQVGSRIGAHQGSVKRFVGELRDTNSLTRKEFVVIVLDHGPNQRVYAPPSIMSDVMPLFFKKRIALTATLQDRTYWYDDIELLD